MKSNKSHSVHKYSFICLCAFKVGFMNFTGSENRNHVLFISLHDFCDEKKLFFFYSGNGKRPSIRVVFFSH